MIEGGLVCRKIDEKMGEDGADDVLGEDTELLLTE